MNWLMNIPVRLKLFLSFGLLAAIVGITGYVGYNGVEQVKLNQDLLYEKRLPALTKTKDIQAAILLIRGDLRGQITDTLKKELDGYRESIVKTQTDVDKLIQDLQGADNTVEEKAKLDQILVKWGELKSVVNTAQSLISSHEIAKASPYLNTQFRTTNRELRKLLIEYSDLNFKEAKNLDDLTDGEANTSRSRILLLLVLAIISSLGLGYILARIIGNRLMILENGAEAVANGNLKITINIDSKDEIGKLADAFNKMIEQINAAFKEVQEKERLAVQNADLIEKAHKEAEVQTAYLSDSANRMLQTMQLFAQGDLTVTLEAPGDDSISKLFQGFTTSVANLRMIMDRVGEAVDATASAAAQISSSSEELAAGAQEQSSQTNEVAGAVEEMTKTILENSQSVILAATTAKAAGERAREGGEVVQKTIEGMNRIATVVQKSADTVFVLGQNSDKIGEIVQVIDDIADQTNLLALNAAIEAARAGEQGRGFAVVADEVRKLAERTTKATKEISVMIKQIQTDTSEAVASMRQGTGEVERGKMLASEAGEVLHQIVEEATKVTDAITHVAAASEEQSAAAEQIAKNIEGISNVTHESTVGIQQVAQATEDLNRLTQNLRDLIGNFKTDSSHDYNPNSRRNLSAAPSRKALKGR
ncbi:MAG: methyl-accepting chemotaxis protein [Ignavibacteria bacterium]|nr:methyl-accepting chemotaxis protein [Ignavibacteria bacterium]